MTHSTMIPPGSRLPRSRSSARPTPAGAFSAPLKLDQSSRRPMDWIARGDTPILMDDTPVTVSVWGEALNPIWWRGRQWAVTDYGIECLDGTYVIEANRLHHPGSPTNHNWPEQLCDKDWVDVDDTPLPLPPPPTKD